MKIPFFLGFLCFIAFTRAALIQQEASDENNDDDVFENFGLRSIAKIDTIGATEVIAGVKMMKSNSLAEAQEGLEKLKKIVFKDLFYSILPFENCHVDNVTQQVTQLKYKTFPVIEVIENCQYTMLKRDFLDFLQNRLDLLMAELNLKYSGKMEPDFETDSLDVLHNKIINSFRNRLHDLLVQNPNPAMWDDLVSTKMANYSACIELYYPSISEEHLEKEDKDKIKYKLWTMWKFERYCLSKDEETWKDVDTESAEEDEEEEGEGECCDQEGDQSDNYKHATTSIKSHLLKCFEEELLMDESEIYFYSRNPSLEGDFEKLCELTTVNDDVDVDDDGKEGESCSIGDFETAQELGSDSSSISSSSTTNEVHNDTTCITETDTDRVIDTAVTDTAVADTVAADTTVTDIACGTDAINAVTHTDSTVTDNDSVVKDVTIEEAKKLSQSFMTQIIDQAVEYAVTISSQSNSESADEVPVVIGGGEDVKGDFYDESESVVLSEESDNDDADGTVNSEPISIELDPIDDDVDVNMNSTDIDSMEVASRDPESIASFSEYGSENDVNQEEKEEFKEVDADADHIDLLNAENDTEEATETVIDNVQNESVIDNTDTATDTLTANNVTAETLADEPVTATSTEALIAGTVTNEQVNTVGIINVPVAEPVKVTSIPVYSGSIKKKITIPIKSDNFEKDSEGKNDSFIPISMNENSTVTNCESKSKSKSKSTTKTKTKTSSSSSSSSASSASSTTTSTTTSSSSSSPLTDSVVIRKKKFAIKKMNFWNTNRKLVKKSGDEAVKMVYPIVPKKNKDKNKNIVVNNENNEEVEDNLVTKVTGQIIKGPEIMTADIMTTNDITMNTNDITMRPNDITTDITITNATTDNTTTNATKLPSKKNTVTKTDDESDAISGRRTADIIFYISLVMLFVLIAGIGWMVYLKWDILIE